MVAGRDEGVAFTLGRRGVAATFVAVQPHRSGLILPAPAKFFDTTLAPVKMRPITL